MYWYFFSSTLFLWPLNSLLPSLFYWFILFLQHNSLKTVIFSFFFPPSSLSPSSPSFLLFPQCFFPGLLSSPYFSHHLARKLLLISLSERVVKTVVQKLIYLWFPVSMRLEVLMIRTGEMMYETNIDALKKTNVAQMCCRDNMDRFSLNRNHTKQQVANYDGMN